MKSYTMITIALETTEDADIIEKLQPLRERRRATIYIREAIREKMKREVKAV